MNIRKIDNAPVIEMFMDNHLVSINFLDEEHSDIKKDIISVLLAAYEMRICDTEDFSHCS
ncbi:hypothetical protein LJC07_08430 [Christensenellaceae bacterium OttesenSCG-928-L17]|nr:hypothetical protein [Christensenellaceae bacterium OttesenSCG-928-L17]